MATYEELSKTLDKYESQKQPLIPYEQMVRERYGVDNSKNKSHHYESVVGQRDNSFFNTINHYTSGMNFFYTIGIVIFIFLLIKKDFNTALKVTIYWFGFWSLLYFVFSSSKIGESIVVFSYVIFVFGGFILFALKK